MVEFVDALPPAKNARKVRKEVPVTQDRLVYDRALTGLQLMTPTDALAKILSASGYMQQIFLVAEQDGLNRGVILNRFPKPPDRLKEQLHGSR